MACTSAIEAKSKYLRQMKGPSSARKRSPAAMSPAMGARLDEGGPLPVLPQRLVIGVRGSQRHRGGGRARIRPEAIIDSVDVALRGAFLQELRQALREAREEGVGSSPPSGARPRDRRRPRGRCRSSSSARSRRACRGRGPRDRTRPAAPPHPWAGNAPRSRGLTEHRVDGRRDRGVREIRERPRHGGERPEAADVGERHEERVLRAVAAQAPADGLEIERLARCRASHRPLIGDDRRARRLRRPFGEAGRDARDRGSRAATGRANGRRARGGAPRIGPSRTDFGSAPTISASRASAPSGSDRERRRRQALPKLEPSLMSVRPRSGRAGIPQRAGPAHSRGARASPDAAAPRH